MRRRERHFYVSSSPQRCALHMQNIVREIIVIIPISSHEMTHGATFTTREQLCVSM